MTWRFRPHRGMGALLFAGTGALIGILLVALVIPPVGPAPVTVTGVVWSIVQGQSNLGLPWFGPSPINESGPSFGYPIEVTSGGKMTIVLILLNGDNVPHTIVAVTATPPLAIISITPLVPIVYDPGEDGLLVVVFQVNATAGSTVLGEATITATT